MFGFPPDMPISLTIHNERRIGTLIRRPCGWSRVFTRSVDHIARQKGRHRFPAVTLVSQPALCAAYSCDVRSGPVDVTSTLRSHPAPYGSELTTEGSSTADWLISTTVPETGEYSSDTDLVDSISPTTAPATRSAPTAGSSR